MTSTRTTNEEKVALWKAVSVMAVVITGLVTTLYVFQVGRINDHELRLRKVEACSIEVAGDIKSILKEIKFIRQQQLMDAAEVQNESR